MKKKLRPKRANLDAKHDENARAPLQHLSVGAQLVGRPVAQELQGHLVVVAHQLVASQRRNIAQSHARGQDASAGT